MLMRYTSKSERVYAHEGKHDKSWTVTAKHGQMGITDDLTIPHGPVQVLVQSLSRGNMLQNEPLFNQLLSHFGADKHQRFLLEKSRLFGNTLKVEGEQVHAQFGWI